MATQKFNPDSFGTFLREMNKYESEALGSEQSDAQEFLLAKLGAAHHMAIPALFKESGMRVSDFKESLGSLQELGLVTLTGEKGREVVRLTENGRLVAESLQ